MSISTGFSAMLVSASALIIVPSLFAQEEAISQDRLMALKLSGQISNAGMPQPIAGSQQCAAICAADLIEDGFVNVNDLLAVINGWGVCVGCPPQICNGDANQDCVTNVNDLLMVINGWGPCPTPSNDNCSNPEVINPNTNYPFCTTYATTDGPSHSNCNFCCNDLQIHKDLWYQFNTSQFGANAWAQLETCGSEFDTKIAVYRHTGVGLCSCNNIGAALVACNDDASLTGCSLQSRVRFPMANLSCYSVRVGGYNNQSGAGNLRLRFFPNGDECFNAIDLGQVTSTISLVAQGNSASSNGWTPGVTIDRAPCTTLPDGNDIWYKFTIGCGGNVLGSVSTCDPQTNYDTILTLYRGTCDGLVLVGCNDDYTGNPACQLNGLYRKSVVDLPIQASPGFYYVRLSGFNNQTGNYVIRIGLGCVN